MRWKTGHHGHDPRQIDLLAAVTLLVIIVAACLYVTHRSEVSNAATFVVPSQNVRW